MAKLEIHQFPCLSDNFGVLIHDAEANVTASIDAPDAKAVTAALAEKGWTLTHILTTHHHGDHTDGNLALKSRRPLHHHRAARGSGEDPGHRQGGRRGRRPSNSVPMRSTCSTRRGIRRGISPM